MISFDTLLAILKLIQYLAWPVAAALAWLYRSVNARVEAQGKLIKDQEETIKEQSAILHALRASLSICEAGMKDMPTQQAISVLQVAMERISGDLRAVSEKVGGVEKIVDKLDRTLARQEQFLLNKEK
ncbi:MAG: hypothetical protein AB7E47_12895 [Desulfovibrionaceae bacterium]